MLRFNEQTAPGAIGFDPSSVSVVRKQDGTPAFGRVFMPIELCNIPGVIADTVQYTMSRSRYPNIRTATIGALAMVSFAAARGYRTEGNLRTPLYLVAAANSGAGKDEPRKVNQEIALACGAIDNVGESVASGEGLEDYVLAKAKILLQNDEFDTLLNAISKDQGGTKEYLVGRMLNIFTSAGGMLTRRKLSNGVQRPGGNSFCVHPSMTMFATAVPDVLYKAFNERSMQNGFTARCLIADCGVRGEVNPDAKYSEVPDSLIQAYKLIFMTQVRNGKPMIFDDPTQKRDEVRVVCFSDEAKAFLADKEREWDEKYHGLDMEDGGTGEQSMRARTYEMVVRCAMCYAISANPMFPHMGEDAVRWAAAFVEYCQGSMLSAFAMFSASNEVDERMKRVKRMFARRRTLTRREISRGLRILAQDVKAVLDTMESNGEILDVSGDGTRYQWVDGE